MTNPNNWLVVAFLCRDLTGDHRPEMTVLFSPAPGRDPAFLFIFRPDNGHWRLTYTTGTSSLTYIWALSVRGRDLIEKRPFFGRNGLCCPAGFTYWAVHWDGHRWTVHRTHA